MQNAKKQRHILFAFKNTAGLPLFCYAGAALKYSSSSNRESQTVTHSRTSSGRVDLVTDNPLSGMYKRGAAGDGLTRQPRRDVSALGSARVACLGFRVKLPTYWGRAAPLLPNRNNKNLNNKTTSSIEAAVGKGCRIGKSRNSAPSPPFLLTRHAF